MVVPKWHSLLFVSIKLSAKEETIHLMIRFFSSPHTHYIILYNTLAIIKQIGKI